MSEAIKRETRRRDLFVKFRAPAKNYSDALFNASDYACDLEEEISEYHLHIDEQADQIRTLTDNAADAVRRLDQAHIENSAMRDQLEAREEALQKIAAWADAYPIEVFPEPDWEAVNTILANNGQSLSCVSAHNMRHVVEGVGKIARNALVGVE